MVRQAQKEGQAKAASPEVARVASSIKKSDAKDFASTKHKGLPEKKKMNEEGYDHYRDNILMKGGDHRSKETKNKSYTPSKPMKGKTAAQKAAKGKSALEIVKDKIRKEYGKGAIMGEENLEEKKKGLWDNIHAKRKRGEKPAKKGDKDYPETLNVEDVNCDDRKKMVADHGALHKKKSDETGGLPRPVAAKNRVATKQGVDEEVITERQKDSDGQRLSQERGRSNYGKASIRNVRHTGEGGNAADPAERLVAMDARHKKHFKARGVKTKGMKEETALDKAKKNIGRDPDKKTCWTGYKAKGTKMKGGKSVPDCQKEGVMGMVKRAAGVKQKPAKKTTGRDAGAIAAKIMRDKEQKKYVGFLPANEEIEMTKKAYNKLHKDFKSDDPKKPRTTKYVPGKGTVSMPVKFVDEAAYTGPDKKDRAVIKKMDNKKFAAKLADYEKNMSPEKRQALKDKATKGMKFTHEGYKGTADLSHMQTPEQKKAADERLKKANEKSYKNTQKEGIKYDSKGSSMDYFLGADPKKTKEYKALKKKKTQKEGTSYGLYKGTGKASGAMKKYLDKKAKMLTKKRDAQSDAAKNNPHFDSTQPSPSGRNKYEQVSFKDYFTEGNNTARMLHKSKTSVTGNISADRGGDEKKNQASRKGLEKDLKKKGIGYKKGVGKYKYDSGETGTEVSYQTSKPDKMSKRRFGKTMRRLGRKHGQESVITKDKSKPARLHDTESKKPGKSINIGKSKGGSNPSGMGQTSGDKVRSGKLPSKSKKGAYHYG